MDRRRIQAHILFTVGFILMLVAIGKMLYEVVVVHARPHPPDLVSATKDDMTIYYNITSEKYAKYIREHGSEPPLKPVLVIREGGIIYVDNTSEPARAYAEALQAYENYDPYRDPAMWTCLVLFVAGLILGFVGAYLEESADTVLHVRNPATPRNA